MVSNPDSSLSRREADDAIRITNTRPDTLIGKCMVTVASAVYGSRAYLAELAHRQPETQWIGVECCEFHRSWIQHASTGQAHWFECKDCRGLSG